MCGCSGQTFSAKILQQRMMMASLNNSFPEVTVRYLLRKSASFTAPTSKRRYVVSFLKNEISIDERDSDYILSLGAGNTRIFELLKEPEIVVETVQEVAEVMQNEVENVQIEVENDVNEQIEEKVQSKKRK